jgi:SWIM zinc finger
MSTLRETLRTQLARFDDDAFAALANRGLLRRARKDLEKEKAEIIEETPMLVAMLFAGHRIEFDARGPSQATCSCPAHRACQHVLAAAITLASLSAESSERVAIPPTPSETEDPLEPLRKALLEMTSRELRKHAGKAGYRWAWQFVQDLDIEKDAVLSGERNVAIAFRHPPVSFRYMGGPVEALLPNADIKQPEKYRVAAVLVFQRAHGKPLEPPDDPVAKTASLNLGKDHALAEETPSALLDSRVRLMAAVRQLAAECVKLGLAHFSPGIHERFETLAVWAQGAQCYRLALLLRRIADHVEMLLARAGGAHEQRLFDELAFANALVSALESAAARGKTPAALIGRARNEYEEVGQLELLGLGASPWRSASGYLGLTMLFWSPIHQLFYSCTDARPEVQRGFDPVARYKTPGPWSGLGAPSMATGRRIVLTGALTSAVGRVSASERTTATVMPADPDAFVAQLPSYSRWIEVARERSARHRSLLAEAQPLKDWVILRPKNFKRAEFDAARQTMRWGLVDDQDEVLSAELSYDKYTAVAIERLEHIDAHESVLVVARLHGGASNFVAEPLSLIRLSASADSSPVDSLFFDAAQKQGLAERLLSKLSRRSAVSDEAAEMSAIPPLLSDARNWLRLLAERGLSADATTGVRDEFKGRLTRLASAGFSAFGNCISADTAVDVLRAQYLCMQYEHLLDDSGERVA